MMTQQSIQLPAGFELREVDDHLLTLMYCGRPVGTFQAIGVDPNIILSVCDAVMRDQCADRD